ncbi:NlpD-related protein family M37 unassigned peptidase (NlpD protein) [Mariprofundus sp. EBB-1]|uniref:murein hydrolase activator EnvC family protein n=1 Tax=Mariprofundus sp. EBB-1 TaxID=2650971 RepID=UPI000EF2059F|nr:peptidoglycan DD-metalloendopeptidase family protein [Mariprofundus sp. EBB-1]RLL55069.1 NlpD-related protein family M37 unassigned peptidase (NlpD protein) [Mariprofundus sp. EBB-1]
MNIKPFIFLLLVTAWSGTLLVAPVWLEPAWAATDTHSKIKKIKQERQRLAKVKKKLEAQLGSVGRELRELDSGLIKARKESREAHANVLATDKKLVELKRKAKELDVRIRSLKQAMLDQAVAAWQRSSHSSAWLGVLTGVPVSDIPHRRFLLHEVIRSEENNRRIYKESIEEMAQVTIDLNIQRQQLEAFRLEKRKTAIELSAQVKAKRKVIDRVRKRVKSKNQKDKRLAREERALMKLLENMSKNMLAIDQQQAEQLNIRKRKGRLKWPVRGRIMASFRSRPKASMPRLQGIQMRPNTGVKEVHAMAAGQVRYADWFGGYGLMTIVDYGEGVLGVYAHNDTLYKQLGDWVDEGEIIADVGSTGWVKRVTLYFEVRDKGKAVNPKRWCRR